MISRIKPRTTEPLAQLVLAEWPSRVNGTITLKNILLPVRLFRIWDSNIAFEAMPPRDKS